MAKPRKVRKLMFAAPYGTELKNIRHHKQQWHWGVYAPDRYKFGNGVVIHVHDGLFMSRAQYGAYKYHFRKFRKVDKS